MCGIVAYKGKSKCLPFLLDGLKRLEYRGYDSAGVAYLLNDQIFVQKHPGSVIDLINNKIDFEIESYMGMGHTRWATHGRPCYRNAHPHATMDDRLCIVHNGIIENYESLKIELKDKGYSFKSDTDTEVLLYLIYDYLIFETTDLLEAVKLALERVVGAYAIVVMDRKLDNRHKLVIARKGSPLVVGIGKEDGEFFVGSDSCAFVNYADRVVYIEDNVVGEITDTLKVYSMNNWEISKCNAQKIVHQLYDIEKNGFDHFMIKEIYEQPKSISNCLAGRIDGYNIKLGGLLGYEDKFKRANNIIIVACGSSWYAGLLGKYYIEEFCNKKVSVEYASEFRYRKPAIHNDDIVIGISQSGETADTIEALKLVKEKNIFSVGICNVVNSSIARMTDCGIYARSGNEIGVASTKAFMGQIVSMLLLALWMEQNQNGIVVEYRKAVIDELKNISKTIDRVLALDKDIRGLAKKIYKSKNCLYLGRGYNYPIAMEGALKLKEVSYIHAEGYPAAEMKHGPIALVDKKMPVIILSNNKKQYDKIVNNIKEIQAREGVVVEVYSGHEASGDLGIKVPNVIDALSPLVSVVVLQLLAYHCAIMNHRDVDKPRNLAKSVTVE